MRHHTPPDVGNWYRDREYSSAFKVVAMDDIEKNIEVQYFAGEIEEIDLDSWYERDLRSIPAPEDSTGPFEATQEELGYYDDITSRPEDWLGPLNEIEPIDSDEFI